MKKWNYILAGVLGSTLILGGTAAFAKSVTEKITVRFANINFIVNGQTIRTKAEPFIYNGNVYAPVATVANMLGIKQEWDNKTPAVRFTDPNAKMEGPDSLTTDHPIGNGLHLWRNAGYNFTLEDRVNGITLPIPVPEELEGKSEGQSPITPARPHLDFVSNDSKSEFYMFHYGNGREVFLQLLQYEKGKLASLGVLKVADDPNRVFGFYNEGRNSIYVQTYDIEGKLNSSVEYVWNHETKRIEKISELKTE